jgi:hypothetical protein
MRALIIIGALVCVAGFILFAMPNAWVNWQEIVTGNVEQTRLEVVRLPQWLGPATVALGLVLMLIGSAMLPRRR